MQKMRKVLLTGLAVFMLSFAMKSTAQATVPVPGGSVTFHWTNWEIRVTGVGQALNGVFRLDQLLDSNNNVVWKHGDGGKELTGMFQNLTVTRFDGETPGSKILFSGGNLKVYLGTAGNFNPAAPGSNPDWIPENLWLDLNFVSGRDAFEPEATLSSIITAAGEDPESVLAIQGIGRGLLDVVGGSAAGLYDTNTYPRLDGSGLMADMTLDANFFIRYTGESPFLNKKDGWDVWSKDPIGANVKSPQPCIDLEKEISIDGGKTWLDADSVGTAAKATAPHGALYGLKVCNCGNVDLTNVVVTDPTLDINHTIGNLSAGACVTLTSTEIPELNVPVRCETAGDYDNTACVEGTDPSGVKVSECDPAWLVCTPPPCIDLEKEISIDGGITWLDADTVNAAATAYAPHGALYRLIVTNCGLVDLYNVTVNDTVLKISNYLVGYLAAGTSVTLTSGQIPELDVPERCKTAGQYDNTACVEGTDANGVKEDDCDPALLVCEQKLYGGCRMTGGNNTVYPDGTVVWEEGTYAQIVQVQKTGSTKKGLATSTEFKYTVGGQIGAPAAGCCTPDVDCAPGQGGYGEWEHSHHENGVLKFSFHAGTHSAPKDSFIHCITCADPGWCVQARCAPFKQIFWEGTGIFQNPNNKKPDASFTVGGFTVQPYSKAGDTRYTLHYYRAHVGDFGEPGNVCSNPTDPSTCKQKDYNPAYCKWTSCGVDPEYTLANPGLCFMPAVDDPKFGDKGGQFCSPCNDPDPRKCGCPDRYEIEIYATEDPSSAVIYRATGWITGGNHQLHPPVGETCPY